MKPRLAFAWFLVSLALTALLVVQWRTNSQRRVLLERVQKQIEKLDQQEKIAKVRAAELETEARQLRAEVRALEIELNSVRMAQNAILQMTNTPAAQAQPGSGGTNRTGPGPGGMGPMLAKMMKDPALRQAFEQQQRIGLDMVFGSLYKELQLTPEQEKAFKDALVELQMSNITQAGTLFDPNATNRTELAEKLAVERKQTEEKIKEILGEENLAVSRIIRRRWANGC